MGHYLHSNIVCKYRLDCLFLLLFSNYISAIYGWGEGPCKIVHCSGAGSFKIWESRLPNSVSIFFFIPEISEIEAIKVLLFMYIRYLSKYIQAAQPSSHTTYLYSCTSYIVVTYFPAQNVNKIWSGAAASTLNTKC